MGTARRRRVPGGAAAAVSLLSTLPALLLAAAPAGGQVRGGARGAPGEGPVDPETAPRPVARAVPAEGPIRVDGRLDEAAWSRAPRLEGFVQSQPRPGYPATEPTVVRILYDGRALYIGAVCYDSEPGRAVVRSLERDFPGESTRNADIFAVTLDTFLDRRNSFIFLVNPFGAYRDAQTYNDPRGMDVGWDGVVEVRTERTDSGWVVEMAIPWTTLRFDPTRERQVWGLNLLRRVRRKNEDSYWAPLDRRDPVHRMSKAGTLVLEGVGALRSGRNLRVKPFAVARRSPGAVSDEGALGGFLDGGLDLKYGVTPELTLDLTYRTDFSQVEVDRERVNLTRFPLFFPEKRDFFVENSGSFTFGDVTERNYRMGTSLRDFTLFHSRRIGLTGDGRPIPIVGGARVTGRIGPYEVGALEIRTGKLGEIPGEDFSVVRLRRNVPGGSDAGVILVNRQGVGGSGGHNRSVGVDANLRLLGALIVNSYLAATRDSEGGVGGLAGRVSVAWRDRFWDVSGMWKAVGRDFRPGVGFVRRPGVRHAYATVGIHPRPGVPWLLEVNPYGELHYVTDPEGGLETRRLTAGVAVELLAAGRLDVTASERFERLDQDFRVRPDVGVPPGAYLFREVGVRYASDKGRRLSGDLSLTGGGYFHGDRLSVGVSGDWRVSPHLSAQLDLRHNAVSLPAGSFTADVVGVRLKFAPSTRLFTSAFIQYNQTTDELVTNLRLDLIHAPLSDLFLVYTERREAGAGTVRERMLTAKVTRLFAF